MHPNVWDFRGTLVMLVALGALLVPSITAGSGATTVVAGQRHTCALTSGGGIQCWGWNQFGQLGDGTGGLTNDRLTPVPVTGLTSGVVAAAAGYYHTCAVTTAGALLCWGGNQYGQLGDGTTTDRWTPVPVNGLTSGVVAVTAGYYHTCALTSAGEVQCWGANNGGRLGDGTTTDRPTPGPVSGLTSGVTAVAAGVHHTCALKDGGVQCWGGNAWGQVGDATTTDRLTPVPTSGLTIGVVALASGSFHSCAVIGGGTVQCWGNNGSGQLGDGTSGPTNSRSTPVPVVGLGSSVTAVTAGQLHTCVRTSTGGAVCWGGNQYGQLGDGTTNDRVTPAPVTGLQSGVAQVAAGQWQTCALTTSAAVACWGYNGSGGLGDGTTSDRHTAVTVHGFEGGAPTITTVNPPAGKVAVPHLLALEASGGVSPYSWTLVSGTIPPGLALSAQGVLSGQPLLAGIYTFRVRVTGADTASSEADLSLTIDKFRRYFAEGATSGLFDCYFALVNPSSTTGANVTLYFLRYDSQTFPQNVHVPPLTRLTIDVKSVPGMALAPSFSTILEADVEVVADRTMSWGAAGYGSHAETSIKEPAQTWYLAEGATQNGLQLYYVIENPNPVPVDVTVTYLRRSPNPAFDIVYPAIPAYTRKTIYVNGEDARLVSGDVSGVVTSTAGGPDHRRARDVSGQPRTRSSTRAMPRAGVTAPMTDWFLAEGATVWNFDMFILLANPGDTCRHCHHHVHAHRRPHDGEELSGGRRQPSDRLRERPERRRRTRRSRSPASRCRPWSTAPSRSSSSVRCGGRPCQGDRGSRRTTRRGRRRPAPCGRLRMGNRAARGALTRTCWWPTPLPSPDASGSPRSARMA